MHPRRAESAIEQNPNSAPEKVLQRQPSGWFFARISSDESPDTGDTNVAPSTPVLGTLEIKQNSPDRGDTGCAYHLVLGFYTLPPDKACRVHGLQNQGEKAIEIAQKESSSI